MQWLCQALPMAHKSASPPVLRDYFDGKAGAKIAIPSFFHDQVHRSKTLVLLDALPEALSSFLTGVSRIGHLTLATLLGCAASRFERSVYEHYLVHSTGKTLTFGKTGLQ